MKICPVCKRFYSDAYHICRVCGLESGKSAPYLIPVSRKERLKDVLRDIEEVAKSLNRS